MEEGLCLGTPLINKDEADQEGWPIPWMSIYIYFRIITAVVEEIGMIDQYRLLLNDKKCTEIYGHATQDRTDEEFMEQCPEEETEKMKIY